MQGSIWCSCNNTEVAVSGYCCFLWAPWPLVSTADRRLARRWAMAHWGLITAGQGGMGCSLSHFLTRREDCACRQLYMVQLHLLQTAKLHLKVRGAKISISPETWQLKLLFNTAQVIHLQVRSLVYFYSNIIFLLHSSLVFTKFHTHLAVADWSAANKWLVQTPPTQTKITLHTAFVTEWEQN